MSEPHRGPNETLVRVASRSPGCRYARDVTSRESSLPSGNGHEGRGWDSTGCWALRLKRSRPLSPRNSVKEQHETPCGFTLVPSGPPSTHVCPPSISHPLPTQNQRLLTQRRQRRFPLDTCDCRVVPHVYQLRWPNGWGSVGGSVGGPWATDESCGDFRCNEL